MLFGRRRTRSADSNPSLSSSRTARSRAIEKAANAASRQLIEQLETRVLLTTLTGGGQGQTNTFEYIDASNHVVRIALQGDITAEFIGVSVPRKQQIGSATVIAPNQPTAINLRPPIMSPPEGYGVDLYAIYVTKADINSSISIAQVPDITAEDRPMEPFSGNAGDFRILNGRTGRAENISPDDATGALLLGARTTDTIDNTTDEEKNAILSVKLTTRFGVRPASAKGKLDPGITVASGVNLGQFLFGGTIIGSVSIGGSINLFYAGEIWTGDATGMVDGSFSTRSKNFTVAGDLRNLITAGAIGTNALNQTGDLTLEPDFDPGTDIRVAGRLGQVLTKTDYMASLGVTHDPKIKGPGNDQTEIEVRDVPLTNSDSFFEGDPFSDNPRRVAPSLGDSAAFNNDTPATAQFLGTFFASNVGKGTDDVIHLTGELDDIPRVNDQIDYYAVALIAGQTIQIKTTSSLLGASQQVTLGLVSTGLIDPEGRVVASDYTNGKDSTETMERAFRWTAKEPGVYRIAISRYGDSNFNTTLDDGEEQVQIGQVEYTLDVSHIADIALGGLVASGSLAFINPELSLDVANGDVGAIVSAQLGSNQNAVLADDLDGVPAITVRAGNLRSIEAATIGIIFNNDPIFGPDLLVPRGIVGMLRGTGPDDTTQTVSVNLNYLDRGGSVDPTTAIGLDYQLVDAKGGFNSNLIADRGIGVVRASTIGTIEFAPRIAANADSRGNDGFVDEIDSSGHFGTLAEGGPQISVGPGGNVRYLHADDPSLVFRDRFFGGGTDNIITTSAGKAYNFTDDSGTPVKITPTGGSATTTDSTGTIVTDSINPGLALLSYGIRGSGGSVLMYVQPIVAVDDSTVPVSLQIDTGSNGGAGSIEIGEIDLLGGAATTFDPLTRSFTTASSGTANLKLKGRRTVDVFDVVGTNLNDVSNDTDGEIVNLTADSLGTLSATTIGTGKSHTGTELQSVDIKADTSPFNQARTLIDITGDASTIRARKQLGNIQVGGTIGTLAANYDKANDKNLFEGIIGPVVAGAVTASSGNIISVDIGEGLAPSGTGEFALSGIFATGAIGTITNQGAGSDIRGDIVTEGNGFLPAIAGGGTGVNITRPLKEVDGIGEINLVGGAIIDADIMAVTAFTDALETHVTPITLTGDTPLGDINVTDGGGIIGSVISSSGGEQLNIKHGFGIIDSFFQFSGTTVFQGIDTDGYGIRDSSFDGGDTINKINVRGDGKVIDTRSYTASVRESEAGTGFDTFSGQSLGDYNDLHTFLGTSKSKPKNASKSISGSIDDTLITGAQNLGSLTAFDIRGTNQSEAVPTMRVSFAQSVGTFSVTNSIDGLDFTAGSVNTFSVGKDTANTNFTASGLVGSIISGGNLKATAVFNIEGSEGRLKSLVTKRAMNASLNVSTKIDSIHIGTDLGSTSINSSNDIGMVIIDGSILGGATLRAADQIASLNIGKNINVGGTVRAKRISAQNIKGAVRGNIITG